MDVQATSSHQLRADPFFPSPISAANPLDPLAQPGGNDKPATAQDQPHFNFPRWTPTARCQIVPGRARRARNSTVSLRALRFACSCSNVARSLFHFHHQTPSKHTRHHRYTKNQQTNSTVILHSAAPRRALNVHSALSWLALLGAVPRCSPRDIRHPIPPPSAAPVGRRASLSSLLLLR